MHYSDHSDHISSLFFTSLVLLTVNVRGELYLEPFSRPLGRWEAGLVGKDEDKGKI